MDTYNFFLDKEGHLRSGWRLAIFGIAFLICAQVLQVALFVAFKFMIGQPYEVLINGYWGIAAGHGSILLSGLLIGWACGRLLEELPFSALGCSPHRGWLKNFVWGSILGTASLLFAAVIAFVARGIYFRLDPVTPGAIVQTVACSLFVFVFAAAAEEILFRGYPLQTLTRAQLAWLGVFLTSVPFALVHLRNPNVVRGFTFVNTALAGIWLAVAYLRTRSLWMPLGLHWSWNWVQGSVLGLPVSGIERISPAPLLKATNAGPDWLTGGAYGIEGGAACTIALLISIVAIWQLKLFTRAGVPDGKGSESFGVVTDPDPD